MHHEIVTKNGSAYEGINGSLYRNYSVAEMPVPRNDYAFNQGVEGKDGFLCEYSFHPKMTHYNIHMLQLTISQRTSRKKLIIINHGHRWMIRHF